MKIGIMQPYFFPYIGYFQLISSVDKFIVYSNVNFIKKGWINRNRILQIGNGPAFITVPLVNQSSFCKINNIRIDNTKDWNSYISKVISYNYKKSAYYNEVYPIIEKLFDLDTDSISELNYLIIKEICRYLSIDTYIENDLNKYNSIENDLESCENEVIDRRILRILKICGLENSDTYVNPIGGLDLYSKRVFKDNGIDLKFVNTLEYQYKQNSNQFYSNLSIIDVLMNCGWDKTRKLLDNYEVI